MRKWNLLKLSLCAMSLFVAAAFTACVDDNADNGVPYLKVSPEVLAFAADGTPPQSGAVFTVESNRPWTVEIAEADQWVTVEPLSGSGTTRVEVSVPASTENRVAKLDFQLRNTYAAYETVTVRVQQGEVVEAEEIYRETFGTGKASSVAEYDGWVKTGKGASEVTYAASSGVDIRDNLNSTGDYSGYAGSGGSNMMFGQGSTWFAVQRIALPEGVKNYDLTFGASYYKAPSVEIYDQLTVQFSKDGELWTSAVPYTFTDFKATLNWNLATIRFSLKEYSEHLYIKFLSTKPADGNYRIDDIVLATGNGGTEIDLDNGTAVDPEPQPTDALFYENFGQGEKVDGNWAYIDQYTDYSKQGDAYVEGTTSYAGVNSSVRSSSASAPVPPFSGGGNVWMTSKGGELTISKLALKSTQTKLTLSFGVLGGDDPYGSATYDPSTNNVKVELSANGSSWTALTATYEAQGTDGKSWSVATAPFTLKKAVEHLYVRISGKVVRIDDIKLVESAGGQEVDLAGGTTDPETDIKLPTTVVTTFDEKFDTAEKNQIYASTDWCFFSSDAQYPANVNFGWKGNTFNNSTTGGVDRYIDCAPYKSTESQVVAYAVMAPFNVKAAADKKLTLSRTIFYQTADASKLEIVASTTATNANAADVATWEVVKDITLDATDDNKNVWSDVTADLSKYASSEKLYVALRYTGKSNTYRVDNVRFNTGGTTDPETDIKLPTTVVTTFNEPFDTAEKGQIYASTDWCFFSSDAQYPANVNFGWKGNTFNNSETGGVDRYIDCAPYKSTESQVVAYAVMAPFNVKAAASKTLTVSRTIFYQTADASKLEIVASTTATNANAADAATWEVVKDITLDATDANKNVWSDVSADLSKYASSEKLYVALRYTGKSNTYRVDNVRFNTGGTTDPDPDPDPDPTPEGAIVVDFSSADVATPALPSSKTTGTNQYVIGGLTYTISATGTGSYYWIDGSAWGNPEPNKGLYLKEGYIELPAVAGKALVSVTAYSTSGMGGGVTLGINDTAGATVVEAESFTKDTPLTLALDGAENTAYRLVAVTKNAQIAKLALLYEEKGGVTPATPTITGVNPAEVKFTAEGGEQPIEVTVADQGDNALSVSGLSGLFSASVSGNTVKVTAQANTGEALSQTLTIAVAGGNSVTVPVSMEAKSTTEPGGDAPEAGSVLWAETWADFGVNSTTFADNKLISEYDYAGQTLYKEDDQVTYTANEGVRATTSTVKNCEGGHLWFNKNVDGELSTSAIKLYGATSLELSHSQGTSGSYTTAWYSTDGVSWTELGSQNGPIAKKSYPFTVADGTESVMIRLSHSADKNKDKNTRVDNLELIVK